MWFWKRGKLIPMWRGTCKTCPISFPTPDADHLRRCPFARHPVPNCSRCSFDVAGTIQVLDKARREQWKAFHQVRDDLDDLTQRVWRMEHPAAKPRSKKPKEITKGKG